MKSLKDFAGKVDVMSSGVKVLTGEKTGMAFPEIEGYIDAKIMIRQSKEARALEGSRSWNKDNAPTWKPQPTPDRNVMMMAVAVSMMTVAVTVVTFGNGKGRD